MTDLPIPPLPPPTDQICRRAGARDESEEGRRSLAGHAGEHGVEQRAGAHFFPVAGA